MRSIFIMFGLLALLALAGCGGGDDTTAAPSRFGGRWAGTWTGATQSGTLDVTVAQNGTITGSVVNNTLRINGTVAGNVNSADFVTSTYTYPGAAPVHVDGTVSLQPNGHWSGTGTEVQSGTNLGTVTVDLIKQ